MKYLIDDATLRDLADALRTVTGKDRTYTPQEMIEEVTDIMHAFTYILVDEDGNELPAVFVKNDRVLTASPNDIRLGMTAVTSDGIVEGEKEIPPYVTTEGVRLIPTGSSFKVSIKNDRYNYTKLQALFCLFNTSLSDSVATDRVAIGDKVYSVNSTDAISMITPDDNTESINFGIVNTSSNAYVLRYFTIKEEP